METRDTVFLIVMVLSSFLLSFEWLRRFTYKPKTLLLTFNYHIYHGLTEHYLMLISINNKPQVLKIKLKQETASGLIWKHRTQKLKKG